MRSAAIPESSSLVLSFAYRTQSSCPIQVRALDEDERRVLAVRESDLACHSWEAEMLAGTVPASQVLADRLTAAGHAGMQVRSFVVGAGSDVLNLVLWKWRSDRPTSVVLIDDQGRLSGGRAH